jgi:flagellar basal-body rod protein FlgF
VYTNRVQLTPGPLIATGRDLDIAMNHGTVLGVTAPNGELAFTRRGDLKVNTSGSLETGDGFLVRGQNGGPITVPQGSKLTISNDGNIYASDPSQPPTVAPVVVGTLMLRDVGKEFLERRKDGLFQVEGQPPGSDFATGPEAVSITSQALEGSNVNPIDAMVKMIEQSRSFEHQVQMIKEGKSNDESGATMIKLPS